MIFLTTGTQLPFDRMVTLVDEYCATRPELEVFAQVGEDSRYTPRHFPHVTTMSLQESQRCFERAELVIAHAGIGSILTTLGLGKPILMMARRADFGEHRNDHQLGTVARFVSFPHCFSFEDRPSLDRALTAASAAPITTAALARHAPDNMLQELRSLLTR